MSRQQYGGSIGFPVRKDKTFLFGSFEGLRQNAQNSVPLLTNTDIFRPTAAQDAIIGGLATSSLPSVTCFPGVTLSPSLCAFALQSVLTVNPTFNPLNPFLSQGQAALNSFLISQFENEGGVFPYNTRQYLASGRLDHHLNANNELSLSYRYGHDLEESPDVQSLTAYSAGSSVHNYDNNLQA
ncbi:MAG: hypothetical protein ABSG23_08250, partial [Terriglobales bacterium]